MKSIHPLSFVLGFVSGLVILLVVAGGLRLFGSSRSGMPARNGAWQQNAGQGIGAGRMAERLGMTEEDLQKELAAGKTMQEIAAERGAEMPGRGMGRDNMLVTGSGSMSSVASGSGILRLQTGAILQP
ncbi:MAG: hypothetical protein PHW10_00540 [Candidatus Peribacteraceae bacterium]|nr:hypothetical protein [Candidatus Peribacteraceae bacterium]